MKMVHEPPTGCMYDMCGSRKADIKLGMISGNLCQHCRAILNQYGLESNAINAIERILIFIRSEAIGRPFRMNSNGTFVVMRFTAHDENDNAYRHGIKNGLEDVGLTVERADNIVSSSQLLDKVKIYRRVPFHSC